MKIASGTLKLGNLSHQRNSAKSTQRLLTVSVALLEEPAADRIAAGRRAGGADDQRPPEVRPRGEAGYRVRNLGQRVRTPAGFRAPLATGEERLLNWRQGAREA